MHQESIHAKAKIVLIPVLGLVLMYLVLKNRSAPDSSPADLSATVTSDSTEPTAPPPTPDQPPTVTQSEWPDFILADVQDTDPFDRRMISPELDQSTSPNSTLSNNAITLVGTSDGQLPPLKVQAVFQSPQGITALAGDRIIHIGDHLADGSEVIDITPERLVLAKPTIH
jgi:hypothetical protein